MKPSVIFLTAALLSVTMMFANNAATPDRRDQESSGTVVIYSAPEVASLANTWAGVYNASHPGENIVIRENHGSSIPLSTTAQGSVWLISGQEGDQAADRSGFNIVVCREIIVPVINMNNPVISEIFKKGVTREAFAASLTQSGKDTWGSMLASQSGSEIKVRFYVPANTFVQEKVAAYLAMGSSEGRSPGWQETSAITEALSKDPSGVGFCRLSDILTADGQHLLSPLQLLPIDKNGNGRLDYMENIYENLADFSRGVWIGKFPKQLVGSVQAVASAQPSNRHQVAFLEWVMGSGQALVNAHGYSEISTVERNSQLARLVGTPALTVVPEASGNLARTVLLALIFLFFFVVAASMVFRRYRESETIGQNTVNMHEKPMEEKNLKIPGGIYYDKTHTWAFMEKDGTVKVGIDDFLQHVTGPITKIEMRKAGERIRKGEVLCTIMQRGKQLKLYSPLSGVITAQNRNLNRDSAALNISPYDEGWVYRIEPANWHREVSLLSMADKYRTWLAGEFTRLKDFLARTLQQQSPAMAHVVLQDGGNVADHVLAGFGPEVWEEFQVKFLDHGR